jgi:hypothetical protein
MKLVSLYAIFSFILLITACSKDKFETTPKLEVKDYSSKDLHRGDILKIRLNYFDKEGDLSEGVLFAARVRLNKRQLGAADNNKADTLISALPEFPKKITAEINFQQTWDFLKESISENDTIVFRFAVADKAGHASDTITTDQLIIHLP